MIMQNKDVHRCQPKLGSILRSVFIVSITVTLGFHDTLADSAEKSESSPCSKITSASLSDFFQSSRTCSIIIRLKTACNLLSVSTNGITIDRLNNAIRKLSWNASVKWLDPCDKLFVGIKCYSKRNKCRNLTLNFECYPDTSDSQINLTLASDNKCDIACKHIITSPPNASRVSDSYTCEFIISASSTPPSHTHSRTESLITSTSSGSSPSMSSSSFFVIPTPTVSSRVPVTESVIILSPFEPSSSSSVNPTFTTSLTSVSTSDLSGISPSSFSTTDNNDSGNVLDRERNKGDNGSVSPGIIAFMVVCVVVGVALLVVIAVIACRRYQLCSKHKFPQMKKQQPSVSYHNDREMPISDTVHDNHKSNETTRHEDGCNDKYSTLRPTSVNGHVYTGLDADLATKTESAKEASFEYSKAQPTEFANSNGMQCLSDQVQLRGRNNPGDSTNYSVVGHASPSSNGAHPHDERLNALDEIGQGDNYFVLEETAKRVDNDEYSKPRPISVNAKVYEGLEASTTSSAKHAGSGSNGAHPGDERLNTLDGKGQGDEYSKLRPISVNANVYEAFGEAISAKYAGSGSKGAHPHDERLNALDEKGQGDNYFVLEETARRGGNDEYSKLRPISVNASVYEGLGEDSSAKPGSASDVSFEYSKAHPTECTSTNRMSPVTSQCNSRNENNQGNFTDFAGQAGRNSNGLDEGNNRLNSLGDEENFNYFVLEETAKRNVLEEENGGIDDGYSLQTRVNSEEGADDFGNGYSLQAQVRSKEDADLNTGYSVQSRTDSKEASREFDNEYSLQSPVDSEGNGELDTEYSLQTKVDEPYSVLEEKPLGKDNFYDDTEYSLQTPVDEPYSVLEDKPLGKDNFYDKDQSNQDTYKTDLSHDIPDGQQTYFTLEENHETETNVNEEDDSCLKNVEYGGPCQRSKLYGVNMNDSDFTETKEIDYFTLEMDESKSAEGNEDCWQDTGGIPSSTAVFSSRDTMYDAQHTSVSVDQQDFNNGDDITSVGSDSVNIGDDIKPTTSDRHTPSNSHENDCSVLEIYE